jgi:hypothetical protein
MNRGKPAGVFRKLNLYWKAFLAECCKKLLPQLLAVNAGFQLLCKLATTAAIHFTSVH